MGTKELLRLRLGRKQSLNGSPPMSDSDNSGTYPIHIWMVIYTLMFFANIQYKMRGNYLVEVYRSAVVNSIVDSYSHIDGNLLQKIQPQLSRTLPSRLRIPFFLTTSDRFRGFDLQRIGHLGPPTVQRQLERRNRNGVSSACKALLHLHNDHTINKRH